MKKLAWGRTVLTALLIVAGALILTGWGMTAVADTSGDWEYTVEGANCVVTKYTGTAAVVEIPAQINGYQVTEIGSDAFCGNSTLTSVTIPESVTAIGFEAFAGCTSLTSLNIPAGLTQLVGHTFQGCSSLTSIAIPAGVTVIDENTFDGCSALTSVTIPDGVTDIGMNAFDGCSSLTDVYYGGTEAQWRAIYIGSDNECLANATIHYAGGEPVHTPGEPEEDFSDWEYTENDTGYTITGYTGAETDLAIPAQINGYQVTEIGIEAFKDNTGLTSVTVPNGVTGIGARAFENCSGLTNVTVPSGVSTLETGVFSGCGSLTGIFIPDSVTSIQMFAFRNCAGLTSIAIPESVTSIARAAFTQCSGLTSIAIPSGITSIASDTFLLCGNLASVAIPASVTSIGEWAFNSCSSLTDVYYGGTEAQWNSISIGSGNGPLTAAAIHYNYVPVEWYYTADGAECEINGYSGGAVELTIPTEIDGYRVTAIGGQAFSWDDTLTRVVIPATVTSIGDNAFGGSGSLTSIEVSPDNQYYASVNGVLYDKALTRLIAFPAGLTAAVIPEGVASIGAYAFSDCFNLTTVSIPSTVTSIDDWVFPGCVALTAIEVDAGNTAYASAGGVLYDKQLTRLIVCPGNLTSVAIPEGVTSIGEGAFYGNSNLTAITFPAGLTRVESWAFSYCGSLTSVTLPEGVQSVESWAFNGCGSLTSVAIPASVTNIGESAFYDCEALTDVYYGGTVPQWNAIAIGSDNAPLTDAIIHCVYANVLTLPAFLTEIDEEAFAGMTAIEKVVLPDTCRTIGARAFAGCANLREINVAGVTSFGDGAFDGCPDVVLVCGDNAAAAAWAEANHVKHR